MHGTTFDLQGDPIPDTMYGGTYQVQLESGRSRNLGRLEDVAYARFWRTESTAVGVKFPTGDFSIIVIAQLRGLPPP